jgi:Glycosyltransferase family 87
MMKEASSYPDLSQFPDRATSRSRWLRPALSGAVLVVFFWLVYGVVARMLGSTGDDLNRRYRDFLEFYSGAAALLQGNDVYAAGYLGYIYPPLLAFLMIPLAKLPIAQAAWIWLAVKTGLLAACGWLGAKETQQRLAQPQDRISTMLVLLLGILFDSDKLRIEMNMQQSNLLVLLCFLLALRWLDRRPLLSGLALGFGANIKYVTLVALPYLLLRKRYKVAAATVAGAVFWTLLPALAVGWRQNLEMLRKAVGGLANLSAPHAAAAGTAKVVGPGFGVSIPAFAVRHFGAGGHSATSIAVVCALGLLFFLTGWGIYRAAKVSFLMGRGGQQETQGITPGVVALEWAGLIVIVLAFSPQTNSPHLSLLLLPCLVAAGVLLMPRGQIQGLPLILGLLIMFAGLVLPPGGAGFNVAIRIWRSISGPIWGVLIMYLTLLWVGLRRLKVQTAL